MKTRAETRASCAYTQPAFLHSTCFSSAANRIFEQSQSNTTLPALQIAYLNKTKDLPINQMKTRAETWALASPAVTHQFKIFKLNDYPRAQTINASICFYSHPEQTATKRT